MTYEEEFEEWWIEQCGKEYTPYSWGMAAYLAACKKREDWRQLGSEAVNEKIIDSLRERISELEKAIEKVLSWRNFDGDGISDPLREELYRLRSGGEGRG